MSDKQLGHTPRDQALEQFAEWFRTNYPGPDTIISRPDWHAPKIFRAVEYALNDAAPKPPAAPCLSTPGRCESADSANGPNDGASPAQRDSGGKASAAAEDAIDLFLEYRDKHGYDERAAKAAACNEFAEAESPEVSAVMASAVGQITVECFRAGDGRVFTNVIRNGKSLAHLKAGESFVIRPVRSDAEGACETCPLPDVCGANALCVFRPEAVSHER